MNQRALGISKRPSNAHAASAPTISTSHSGSVMLVLISAQQLPRGSAHR
jgi:hypothetical protein